MNHLPPDIWIIWTIAALVEGFVLGLTLRRRHRQIPPSAGRREAEAKARQLLQRHLTPEEWQRFLLTATLRVPSRLMPGDHYVLSLDGSVLRCSDLWNGATSAVYCIGPTIWLPAADRLLAHKWWLEADEVGWLQRANRRNVVPGAHV